MQREFVTLLGDLPEDVFASVSLSLSPRDICNLSLCCRSLSALVASEKIWFTQCDKVGILRHRDLIEWRRGVSSYKALCRFLLCVEPMIGLWVHQNPELGNVVYAMPGYVSVVGCRIVPQELGPLGIDDGPILWAPVFELIGEADGSPTFFLHGREKGDDCVYPGVVKGVEKSCNVLSLEVEPHTLRSSNRFFHKRSFPSDVDDELSKISRSQRVQPETKVPFNRLAFGDRRRLIEAVTSQILHRLPDSEFSTLFPSLKSDEESALKDMKLLSARRSVLQEMYKFGATRGDGKIKDTRLEHNHLTVDDIRASLARQNGFPSHSGDNQSRSVTKKSLTQYLSASFRHVIGKSPSHSRAFSKSSSSNTENKHAHLQDFLMSGDSFVLSLHASKVKLSSYRAWPNMHGNRFSLYKLPLRVPTADHQYAGLWGGTFGWPPGKPSKDKPGKALFFLLISYEECEQQRLLIATKILEGTHYVLHPNGSAMFVVNIDEPSDDPFPWDVDGELAPVTATCAFAGEGIANGYGFRYPGSKPGTLYIIQNGLLVFVWKESRAVLSMQRLNMEELLKKGERVPPLPPVTNFSYLSKSYSNVFAGFSNLSTFLSSPGQRQP